MSVKKKGGGKKKPAKFDLVKAVKKAARKNTEGLNLATRDHGDETRYDRNEQKKLAREEKEDIDR